MASLSITVDAGNVRDMLRQIEAMPEAKRERLAQDLGPISENMLDLRTENGAMCVDLNDGVRVACAKHGVFV